MGDTDPLTDVLKPVRTRDTIVRRMTYEAPWSMRYEAPSPLTAFVTLSGAARFVPESGPAQAVAAGDLLLVRGSAPYTLVGATDTVLLSCTFPHVHLRLLTTLPPVMRFPAETASRPLVNLMVGELTDDQPGRQAFVDGLLSLMLVQAIRSWLTHHDARGPAWHQALGDDIVGPALRALHDEPARAWTVAGLAAVSAVSRSVLARRFTQLVGEPPLTYLTSWRMALAAERLRHPGTTLTAVAREVGYKDAFAFSAAFKRVHGMSPSDYRDLRTTHE